MEPHDKLYDIIIEEGTTERYTLLKNRITVQPGQWEPILVEGQPIPFSTIEKAKAYARFTFPYAVAEGRIAVTRLWTETTITHHFQMVDPVVVEVQNV